MQQDIVFNKITESLGNQLKWRWEEQASALLTEFSWDKKDKILASLRELFSDEWDKKSIKKAPESLKNELGELTRLNKSQLIFTRPASEEMPTIVIFWWPWGHGSTYSMRMKVLDITYSKADIEQAQTSLFTKLFKRNKVN